MAKMEADKMQRELEREKQRKLLWDEESLKKYKIKEKHYLELKLTKYLPKVLEVNLIAKELKRNVSLSVKLVYFFTDQAEIHGDDEKSKKKKIQIAVNNREEG